MASFNRLILLGNLTRDPEMRYLPNNSPIVEFGIACNRKWKDAQGQDHEEAMFLDCTAFGKPAEIINQYCHRGDLLFCEGRLKLDTWEDKQGGGKRSKHRMVIENFQLMPRRDGDSGQQQQRQDAPTRPAATNAAPARRAPAPASSPISEGPGVPADDIPF